MPDITPPETIRSAARLMRERAQKAAETDWPGRPWAVTECADEESDGCPCIVYQGEYKPFDEPQVPGIQYVCDAEGPELAAHIAGMHPGVALAVADWLGTFEARVEDSDFAVADWNAALILARAYLGEARDA